MKKNQAQYPKPRTFADDAAVIDAAAKKRRVQSHSSLQPLSKLNSQEGAEGTTDYGHLAEKTEHDTRTNFTDESEVTELHSAKREPGDEENEHKKFTTPKNSHSRDRHIENDEVNGALSILYEDETKTKNNSNSKTKDLPNAAKNNNAFDPSRWNFRMLKRAETLSAKGLRKIPLAPQKKLSATEKSSLINRIVRFMIDLFNRLSR